MNWREIKISYYDRVHRQGGIKNTTLGEFVGNTENVENKARSLEVFKMSKTPEIKAQNKKKPKDGTSPLDKVKKSAKVYTLSGTFSGPDDKDLIEHSGFICLDIDGLYGDKMKEIRTKIEADPYTFMCFPSISYTGLAVMVKITSSKHKESFYELVDYYFKMLGIVPDLSCVNLQRLRFQSYAEKVFINERFELFETQGLDSNKIRERAINYCSTGQYELKSKPNKYQNIDISEVSYNEDKVKEKVFENRIKQFKTMIGNVRAGSINNQCFYAGRVIGVLANEGYPMDVILSLIESEINNNSTITDKKHNFETAQRGAYTGFHNLPNWYEIDKNDYLQFIEGIRQDKVKPRREKKDKIAVDKSGILDVYVVQKMILDNTEKIDFLDEIYPERKQIQERINELNLKMIGKDGTFLKRNEMPPGVQQEHTKLEGMLKKMTKVDDKKMLIIIIDMLQEISAELGFPIKTHSHTPYQFNGVFWKADDQEANLYFKKFLGNFARKLGVPRIKAKHNSFLEAMYIQFCFDALRDSRVPPRKGAVINMNDHTLVIEKGVPVSYDHDSDDFLMYSLDFSYNPDARAEKFHAFLDEVLPDKECQNVLSEYLGACFMKGNDKINIEKVPFLYGGGANGKSVFFNIINALFGEANISNYSLQSLTDQNGYYRAKLEGNLLNYCAEISRKTDSAIMKALASNEPIDARLPYKDPLLIKDYARLMFNCNELPTTKEFTEGYFRRFLIIPFNVFIPKEKRDLNLAKKIIKNELPGVLNWVLDGLKRLIDQGRMSPCEVSDKELSKLIDISDSFKSFLNEYLIGREKGASWRNGYNVYTDYLSYCVRSGIKTSINIKTFYKRFEDAGFKVRVVRNKKEVFMSQMSMM